MDAPRIASAYGMKPFLLILYIFVIVSTPLRAQTSISDHGNLADVKPLLTEERWMEVIKLVENETVRSAADFLYYYGTALARLERWEAASKEFRAGLRQFPGDKRFFLGLAGVSFKQKNYREAGEYLRRALELDPADSYAIDFLASVYFLQGNIEAALKYWNQVSKPQIEEVKLEPAPRVDPVLLDRAFAFAPASVLSLSELYTTRAKVDGLKIFPSYRLDLEARSDGKFDVIFRGRERNGWGNGKWEGLLSLFRGLPFQTIHPEFFNIKGRAINLESFIRWDSQKRRLRTNLSGPFARESKWRYQLELDLRNEYWEIRDISSGGSQISGSLNLRKQAFTAGITSVESGRWDWSTGVEISHRDFRNVIPGASLTAQLLTPGYQLKHIGQLNYVLVRVPEKRLTVATSASTQLGRILSEPSNAFAKLQWSLHANWSPQASGDDYEMQGRVSAGKQFGGGPFDELFVLGIERDNDLLLRAHVGTRNGRKGSAPIGESYFLSNWEFDKNIYSNALIGFKLGPFLDSGKITSSSPGLGSERWLWDLGAQAKVRVLGLGVALAYGKDLRSGNNAVYLWMFR
jgi:tetratricopeptide (TPR) repeat protein